jgi:hypothetical protein
MSIFNNKTIVLFLAPWLQKDRYPCVKTGTVARSEWGLKAQLLRGEPVKDTVLIDRRTLTIGATKIHHLKERSGRKCSVGVPEQKVNGTDYYCFYGLMVNFV